MSNPPIEPAIKIGGSAFNGSTIAGSRPLCRIKDKDYLKVTSLQQWCDRNFITRDVGYRLIKLKYLLAFRRHGYYWVCANPDCVAQLKEYLGVEKLLFDVQQ